MLFIRFYSYVFAEVIQANTMTVYNLGIEPVVTTLLVTTAVTATCF